LGLFGSVDHASSTGASPSVNTGSPLTEPLSAPKSSIRNYDSEHPDESPDSGYPNPEKPSEPNLSDSKPCEPNLDDTEASNSKKVGEGDNTLFLFLLELLFF